MIAIERRGDRMLTVDDEAERMILGQLAGGEIMRKTIAEADRLNLSLSPAVVQPPVPDPPDVQLLDRQVQANTQLSRRIE